MKGFIRLSVALLLLVFTSGCSTGSMKLMVQDGPKIHANQKEDLDLMVLPYESLGVKKTLGIITGNIWEVRGIFPNVLFGEYYVGRVRWNAWVINPNGQEYYAQAVLAGLDPKLGCFAVQVFSEGKLALESKVLILSTMVTRGYNLLGKEVTLKRNDFQASKNYRKKMVLTHGTRIGDLRVKIRKGFPYRWNEYSTPKGDLLSPANEKQLKKIAGLNPRYTFTEKLIGTGRFSISPDPIGMLMSIAIDVAMAMNAGSVGWDYSSELPNRRVMGVTMAYIMELQQRLYKQMLKRRTP